MMRKSASATNVVRQTIRNNPYNKEQMEELLQKTDKWIEDYTEKSI